MAWKIISGYDCFVEDNKVKRCIIHDSNNSRVTAYPYRRCGNGWTEAVGVKPATLRAGLKKGHYIIT